MRRIARPICIGLALAMPLFARAEAPSLADSKSIESKLTQGVEIQDVIASVAKKTSKKFIVDPRVRGIVQLIGANPLSGDYGQLLSLLEVNAFAAIESGGYTIIIPESSARQYPTPIAHGNKVFHDSEVVTKVIPVKSLSAASMVPLLRPLLPQYAHLAALPCANSLVVVDHYANIKRIEAVIESMDKGEPYKPTGCASEAR